MVTLIVDFHKKAKAFTLIETIIAIVLLLTFFVIIISFYGLLDQDSFSYRKFSAEKILEKECILLQHHIDSSQKQVGALRIHNTLVRTDTLCDRLFLIHCTVADSIHILAEKYIWIKLNKEDDVPSLEQY